MDIIAHRGYACAGTENSIESVQRAWLAGADGVEVDVRVSADGVPYLFHDDEISGMKLADLTFAELTTLVDTGIATMAELLSSIEPNGYFVFDLKDTNPEKLDHIADVLLNSDVGPEQTSFQSDSPEALAYLGRMLPDTRLVYLSRLRWRIPYLLRPSLKKLNARLSEYDLHGVSVKGRGFIDREFVESLHEAGREIYVWTVNNANRAQYYRSIGVDGLITDRMEDVRRPHSVEMRVCAVNNTE